jgi:hypothetical protein
MSHAGYIVDTTVLKEIPAGVSWHAEGIPGSAKSLVAIEWSGSENHGAEFEARPNILHLGLGEALSAEAAALLSAMNTTAVQVVAGPVTPDTVASALRKVDSAVARLIRWR